MNLLIKKLIILKILIKKILYIGPFVVYLPNKLASINLISLGADEFGSCSRCGKFSRFKYSEVVSSNSKVAISCGWDSAFIREINITNSLNCVYCDAKFRVRCAASSLLTNFQGGKFNSIPDFIKYLSSGSAAWIGLETASVAGIFTNFKTSENIIFSDYFEGVPGGQYKENVRSENLQHLTFNDNSLDAVIALDVFEHIADPWVAFHEVKRVLKPGGLGIITVPIDTRKKTKTLAWVEDGHTKFTGTPSFHLDPLREEGALVFTEFGLDIKEKLQHLGYTISFDVYQTKRTNVRQYVLLIRKP